MIKVSKFARESGSHLADSIANFKIPENPPKDKEKKWFLSGDMTFYGHKDVKMSQKGYDSVKNSIDNSENHFSNQPYGQQKSRQGLAKALSSPFITLKEDDVLLVHGANVGLLHSILSIVNPGENILVPEPSYPFYQKVAKSMNIEARPYKLLPEKQWEIDLNYMESLIDEKTKFIWIVNPSNPCGSVFSKQHLQDILDLGKKYQKLVIGDEVYYNEVFQNETFTSIGHLANEQPVIVVGGMEKTFCVPGWCVSWMAFYDKYGKLSKIKDAVKKSAQLINSPPEIITGALPTILDELTLDFTNQLMPIFHESYSYLYNKFLEIKGLKPIKAQGTFYLSVLIELDKFRDFKSDMDFLQRLLEEENIFILSLSCFGGGVQGFRLMMAAPLKYYDGFVERMSQFCQRHYK